MPQLVYTASGDISLPRRKRVQRTDVDGYVARVDAPLQHAHLGVLAAPAEQPRRLHAEVAHLRGGATHQSGTPAWCSHAQPSQQHIRSTSVRQLVTGDKLRNRQKSCALLPKLLISKVFAAISFDNTVLELRHLPLHSPWP